MLAENSQPSEAIAGFETQASNDGDPQSDLAAQIEQLRNENAALVSTLCGLCVGISQISEVHRAIVAQAFDYADRFALSGAASDALEAGNGRIRVKVIDDIRSVVLRQHRELGSHY